MVWTYHVKARITGNKERVARVSECGIGSMFFPKYHREAMKRAAENMAQRNWLADSVEVHPSGRALAIKDNEVISIRSYCDVRTGYRQVCASPRVWT
jgi:hypothetical protein